jgi:hypothetical protein
MASPYRGRVTGTEDPLLAGVRGDQETSAPICEAIRRHVLLAGSYSGKRRLVEPYCHGVSPNGDPVFMAYQREAGGSASESGWRCFKLSDFVDLTITQVTFVPTRQDYHARNDAIAVMHCAI